MAVRRQQKKQTTHKTAEPLYLVDASIYIFRAYFSMPDNWHADNGYSTHAVYGFAMFLLQLLEKVSPKYVALAFDESLGSCFRNKIYPDYKVSRALPDDELAFQLHSCRELAKKMGFKTFASKRYEADDLIASLSHRFGNERCPVVIVTRDKDLGQLLIRKHDRIWDYADDTWYQAKEIESKFGVKPAQIADYLALVGDSIDDIPGVPGVGAKTAAGLLAEFDTVEQLLRNLDKVLNLKLRGVQKLHTNLEQYREQLQMAKQLATLYHKVPLSIKKSDLCCGHFAGTVSQRKVENLVRQLGFGQRTLTRFQSVYDW